MDAKFSKAVSRGKKKYSAKQARKKAKLVEDRKKKARLNKKKRRAADRWIQENLPKIMELESAKGLSSFSFGDCWSEGAHYAGDLWIPGWIMAEACKEAGLKTKRTFLLLPSI